MNFVTKITALFLCLTPFLTSAQCRLTSAFADDSTWATPEFQAELGLPRFVFALRKLGSGWPERDTFISIVLSPGTVSKLHDGEPITIEFLDRSTITLQDDVYSIGLKLISSDPDWKEDDKRIWVHPLSFTFSHAEAVLIRSKTITKIRFNGESLLANDQVKALNLDLKCLWSIAKMPVKTSGE